MEALKQVLKSQGRSQQWLARQLEVNPVVLNYWIRGKRKMPELYKPMMANILGVPKELLFPKIAS